MTQTFPLDTRTCETMLRAGIVGRLAISTDDGPLVLPVNYSVVGDAVVIRTAVDGPLAGIQPGTTVAFEVDQIDHERHRGWSVHLRGSCRPVEPGPVLDEIEATGPPRPWAGGARELVLRIPWHELTGRQLGAGWDPLRSLAVRRTV